MNAAHEPLRVSIPFGPGSGRYHGSKNKHHLYLCRFLLPDGSYRRVYPDEDEVDAVASRRLGAPVLLPGVSARALFEREVFGSFSVNRSEDAGGRVEEKPIVRPGIFQTYEPTYVGRDPKNRQAAGSMIAGVRSAYKFVPVRRIAGYLSVEWASGFRDLVAGTGPMKAKLAKLKLGPAALAAQAPGEAAASSSPIDLDPAKAAAALSSSPAPRWHEAKFDGSGALAKELAERPATTLLTLGVGDASAPGMAQRLCEEWSPRIVSLVRRFGGGRGLGASRADVLQDAYVCLLHLASSYRHSRDPSDRFDKVAYATLRAHAQRAAAGRLPGGARARVRSSDPEGSPELADVISSELPLDEEVEYARVFGKAQGILSRVLSHPSLHDTHRRALAVRVGALGEVRYVDLIKGCPIWIDPDTSAEIDLSKASLRSAQKSVQRWFHQAIDRVRTILSTPVESPCADKVRVDAPPISAEERLVSALLGTSAKAERSLTADGSALKRWLELEVKLAGPRVRRVLTPSSSSASLAKAMLSLAFCYDRAEVA